MADKQQGTKADASGRNAAKNSKAAAKVRAAKEQKRQRMQWSVGIVVLIVAGVAVLRATPLGR